MGNKIKNWFFVLLSLLFPFECINCKKEGEVLCQDCLSLIPLWANNQCPGCGYFSSLLRPGEFCSLCKKSLFLDGLIVAGLYQNPLLKKAISLLKYQPFVKELASPLASLIISQIQLSNNNFENFVLTWIPLSPKKKRERGFNQTEEIAKKLNQYLHLPCLALLEKQKATRPQMKLSREQRIKNIRGAFSVLKEKEGFIKNKKILIVDDVYTTGATLNEAGKVLKEKGAKEVWGVVLAREF